MEVALVFSVQWFPRDQHCSLYRTTFHCQPGAQAYLGSACGCGPCSTHSRRIAPSDCAVRAEETLPLEGEGCTAARKAQRPQPELQVRKEKAPPNAAQYLGACCFLSMQMGKLSLGEKVTKVLGQLGIVFSMSCSKST